MRQADSALLQESPSVSARIDDVIPAFCLLSVINIERPDYIFLLLLPTAPDIEPEIPSLGALREANQFKFATHKGDLL